jgi:hypothetical protein
MSKPKIIPAGYHLSVTSWENDGDNYNTKHYHTTNRGDIEFIVAMFKMFKENDFENWYEDIEDERIYDSTAALLDEYELVISQELRDVLTDEGIFSLDGFRELLWDLGLSNGEWALRVVDKYEVLYYPVAIKIEDVTSEF